MRKKGFLLFLLLLLTGCQPQVRERELSEPAGEVLEEIPAYQGEAYVPIGDGKADFKAAPVKEGYEVSDLDTQQKSIWAYGYEKYTSDGLSRCKAATALVGEETKPVKKRESISSVRPTGWQNKKYPEIGWVYNRCHLIGYQLTAENANKENLITGTKYLNIKGMLPFENETADYIEETGNHVVYEVTPIYEKDDLVCRGVVMEAYSVEDKGRGVNFDVFCFNVEPGVRIDYATGKISLEK